MKTLNPKRYALNPQKGFTLVELLVAMTIFMVAVSIASAAFIRTLRSQQALVGLMAANDNAALSIEQMTREIRLSQNFNLIGNSELSFINSTGQNIIYRFNETDQVIERSANGGIFGPLTSKQVSIQRLRFILDSGDPPKITILLSVASRERDIHESPTNVQATVSARNVEL
jgi:prepilin-type N-terminal cleavage/methylation domain-containing protein